MKVHCPGCNQPIVDGYKVYFGGLGRDAVPCSACGQHYRINIPRMLLTMLFGIGGNVVVGVAFAEYDTLSINSAIFLAAMLLIYVPKPLMLAGARRAVEQEQQIKWYASPVVWLMPVLLITLYFMFGA